MRSGQHSSQPIRPKIFDEVIPNENHLAGNNYDTFNFQVPSEKAIERIDLGPEHSRVRVKPEHIPKSDPLDDLENLEHFVKRIDNGFESHYVTISSFHSLLQEKARLDQQYSHSLQRIAAGFESLAKNSISDRIRGIVQSLARNFKNFSSNFEAMAYDLLTEVGSGFGKCKNESAYQLQQIKQFLSGATKPFASYSESLREARDSYLFAKKNYMLTVKSDNYLNEATKEQHLANFDRELKYCQAQMNLKLADLNEQISIANDTYINSLEGFNSLLERDFAQVKDAIMKYFLYQTSFLKNTEYDANNIIRTIQEDDQQQVGGRRERLTVNETPFKLITVSTHSSFLSTIDPLQYEKSLGNQLKSAWNSLGWFNEDKKPQPNLNQSKASSPNPSFAENIPDDSRFLIELYESILKSESPMQAVPVRSLSKVKECTERHDARQYLVEHLHDRYSKNQHPKLLRDFSFFPLKDFLSEVITISAEKQDNRTVFMCIFFTQNIRLADERGEGDKHMREFFYSLSSIRTKQFWHTAFVTYKTGFHGLSNQPADEIYYRIFSSNLNAMLYTLRSREPVEELAREFLHDSVRLSPILQQINSIEKISKDQLKKPVFAELYPNTVD